MARRTASHRVGLLDVSGPRAVPAIQYLARTLTVPLMKTSRAMDIDRWLSSSGLQRPK